MGSRKDISVFFLASAASTSAVHRCLSVSQELERRGYLSRSVVSAPFSKKRPRLRNHISSWSLNHIKSWKQIVAKHPDFLILHRSSNLVDYEMIKRIKKFNLRTKIIFDFDDAIFHVGLLGKIASYSHLSQILSMSDRVTAGSHYLAEFACKFNQNVTLLPSAVDMELFNLSVRRAVNDHRTVIGWLGAGLPSQLSYLKILKDPLNKLARRYDFKLKLVSALSDAIKREFTDQGFEVDFGLDHWIPIEQIPDLVSDFDIGVMPLTDGKWERGKCAMKLLEYMAMGLPTVSSAIGENTYVIDQGLNGFLASSPQEWTNDIGRLIVDPDLRKQLGENGYKTVKERYSLQAVVDTLEQVIKESYDTESTSEDVL